MNNNRSIRMRNFNKKTEGLKLCILNAAFTENLN